MADTGKQADILIVDDQPESVDLLKNALEQDGYRIASAASGVEAVERAASKPPDLVLVDMTVPEKNGLEVCRSLKSDPKTEDVVVIFVSGAVDSDLKTEGFSLGAVDCIQKPISPTELRARVQAHLRLKARVDELRSQYEELNEKLKGGFDTDFESIDQVCVHTERKTMSFKTSVEKVQGVVNQLLIGFGGRLTKKARNDLALGLHEMVLNAVEHGNLGITSKEKSAALDSHRYGKLLGERQADPKRANRSVRIEYAFDGKKVSVSIEDEGEGFDWLTYVERDEPEDLLASNGRGILISRFIFDSITYSEKGNRVDVVKTLPL